MPPAACVQFSRAMAWKTDVSKLSDEPGTHCQVKVYCESESSIMLLRSDGEGPPPPRQRAAVSKKAVAQAQAVFSDGRCAEAVRVHVTARFPNYGYVTPGMASGFVLPRSPPFKMSAKPDCGPLNMKLAPRLVLWCGLGHWRAVVAGYMQAVSVKCVWRHLNCPWQVPPKRVKKNALKKAAKVELIAQPIVKKNFGSIREPLRTIFNF